MNTRDVLNLDRKRD